MYSAAKPAGGPALTTATGLPKTNFENYYERKLHEEREGHNAVANKLLMGAIGAKIKDAMQNTVAHGKNSKSQ
jgi:hypothetical protein|tara:strand:- start:875 stop:1093 length:219 start_codon:yes stop_codon:yes gene_type:complete